MGFVFNQKAKQPQLLNSVDFGRPNVMRCGGSCFARRALMPHTTNSMDRDGYCSVVRETEEGADDTQELMQLIYGNPCICMKSLCVPSGDARGQHGGINRRNISQLLHENRRERNFTPCDDTMSPEEPNHSKTARRARFVLTGLALLGLSSQKCCTQC